jgi:hypothetical protein
MWGHVKEKVHAVPSRTVEDPVARLPAAETTVNAYVLRRVWKRAMRGALLSVLKWMEAASSTYCNHETPMV